MAQEQTGFNAQGWVLTPIQQHARVRGLRLGSPLNRDPARRHC